ncbi:hypothetical protein CVS40_8207 [Lucilia cuprina]|nr:hypothetical protein CVS40_8207 [Lucilia cuprina]
MASSYGAPLATLINKDILQDLKIRTVKEEIQRYSQNYLSRLDSHPNPWI